MTVRSGSCVRTASAASQQLCARFVFVQGLVIVRAADEDRLKTRFWGILRRPNGGRTAAQRGHTGGQAHDLRSAVGWQCLIGVAVSCAGEPLPQNFENVSP